MATKKSHPLGFAFDSDQVSGLLRVGLSIKGVVHKDFVMRAALVEDMLESELEAGVDTPLNFNAAMMTRQLVRVGTFDGPFTIGMLGKLKPADWRILRAAQGEVDALGEGESASGPAS